VGLDLGQAADFTTLAVAERVEGEVVSYDLRHLERLPLGTTYPAIAKRVSALMATREVASNAELVVDATGVGAPVLDLLRDTGLSPREVTITGGDTVSEDGDSYRVPKRDLVSTVSVLLQSGRLRIAACLPEAETLVKELLNFQVKITNTANNTYGAWREGTHDDLVLAVALACWYGNTYGQGFHLAVVSRW